MITVQVTAEIGEERHQVNLEFYVVTNSVGQKVLGARTSSKIREIPNINYDMVLFQAALTAVSFNRSGSATLIECEDETIFFAADLIVKTLRNLEKIQRLYEETGIDLSKTVGPDEFARIRNIAALHLMGARRN